MARNLQAARRPKVESEAGAVATEEFMSAAAHDLRNPIAVVRASAQMAQRQIARGETSSATARLDAIVEQTDRLTEMLDTFLDAARLSTGQLPLRREQLDLRDIVDAAGGRARGLAGGVGGRMFEIDIPEGCVGSWDRARLVRAISALLSNALQYGDVAKPVQVDAARDGNRVRVTISGGGRGPDAKETEHLFERFYRGPSAAESGQAGSGLGLFTARGIARAHGGEVRRLDGDRFEIELPLQ